MVPNGVQAIINNVGEIGKIFDIVTAPFDEFSQFILEKLDTAYIQNLFRLKEREVDGSMKMVYTLKSR